MINRSQKRETADKNREGLSNNDAYFLKIKYAFLEEEIIFNNSSLIMIVITPWKCYLKKKIIIMNKMLIDWNLLFNHGNYTGFNYISWFWSNIYEKG